jgi:hypothetical protein
MRRDIVTIKISRNNPVRSDVTAARFFHQSMEKNIVMPWGGRKEGTGKACREDPGPPHAISLQDISHQALV